MLLTTSVIIIHNNTLVHPYLLADNRHYTFYLWQRLYARHYTLKYVMSVVYLYGAHLLFNVCLQKRSNIFRVLYLLCVALSIVPQRLLEPRYFILPFLIARIQCPPFVSRAALYSNRSRRGRAASRSSYWKNLCSTCTTYINASRRKLNRIFNAFPHVCWEFLYYILINLATLAIFGTKTFWWKDFTEPQRIMW